VPGTELVARHFSSGIDVFHSDGSKKLRSEKLTGTPGTLHYEKRSGARAFLRGAGWKDDDFKKPIITVANPWSTALPCNLHFRELGDIICNEIERRGGKAFTFGTPVVADGQVQGMVGMRYSLVSRDLIADCIETMHEAYQGDCIISLGGCDKTLPASLMPLARGDALGLTMYGGSCRPGPSTPFEPFKGRELNAGSPYEARGALAVGLIDDDEYKHVECTCIPGAGACGGMFTANTMASCIEALGMSLPNSSSHPSLKEGTITMVQWCSGPMGPCVYQRSLTLTCLCFYTPDRPASTASSHTSRQPDPG
jgi:dihydroxy-acid dehydratase